jgi:tetratricopeptide (TPR) repeat protein
MGFCAFDLRASMTSFPHTCFGSLRSNHFTFRLIGLLCIGFLFASALETQPGLAEEASGCAELDRAKWALNPPGEDLYLLALDLLAEGSPEISMTACWSCGLWAEETSLYPAVPSKTRETLLLEQARCYLALGMDREALEGYRRILREYPNGQTWPTALQSLLGILVQQRNHKAVASLFQTLDPDQYGRLLPASLYLIAQSLYLLGQDGPAEDLLEQVPPDTDAYPYALYNLAQIFYRKGDSDRALLIIRVVHDAPPEANVPELLREMAWLTESRMLFQQKSYEKAIQGFRSLGPSSLLLPDALMGIGWCYLALEDFPRAIAHFQAVEESGAEGDTITEAGLQTAYAFSKAKMYQDAFENYRVILNDLHFRISQYKKYGEDPEWLTWLAEGLLADPMRLGENPEEAPVMNQEGDLPEEILPLLRRAEFTSPRMKELFGIREGLEQVGVLLDSLAAPTPPGPAGGPVVSVVYPPLGVPAQRLDPQLSGLLNLHFALLDTEYRLIHSGSLLGLLSQTEKNDFMQDAMAFYRGQIQALLLPGPGERDAHDVLNRLQSTVRHLPLSLDQKETVLDKLVYTRKVLEETESVLARLAEGVQETVTCETQPTRLLLLEKWMTLVRVHLYLRSWDERSPPVFLLDHPSLAAYRPMPIPPSQDMLARVSERLDRVWRRLALLVEREVANLHLARLDVLEGLLARAQFDYADALVQEQERIVESLHGLPDEGKEEGPAEDGTVKKEQEPGEGKEE